MIAGFGDLLILNLEDVGMLEFREMWHLGIMVSGRALLICGFGVWGFWDLGIWTFGDVEIFDGFEFGRVRASRIWGV